MAVGKPNLELQTDDAGAEREQGDPDGKSKRAQSTALLCAEAQRTVRLPPVQAAQGHEFETSKRSRGPLVSDRFRLACSMPASRQQIQAAKRLRNRLISNTFLSTLGATQEAA
jgi:hypothetical protein